jgi:hypothetical protein
MHRPFIVEPAEHLDLSPTIQSMTGDTPQQYLSRIAIRACTSSSISITRILALFRNHYSLRHVVFIAVHFALNAATIHVHNTRSNSENVRKRTKEDLQLCKEFLEEMFAAWPTAQQALNDVEEMERTAAEDDADKEVVDWRIFSMDTESLSIPVYAANSQPMDTTLNTRDQVVWNTSDPLFQFFDFRRQDSH